MTDTDRLRVAADVLDGLANGERDSIDTASLAAQDRATAALLRAVADESYVGGVPHLTRDAANLLADAILGEVEQ